MKKLKKELVNLGTMTPVLIYFTQQVTAECCCAACGDEFIRFFEAGDFLHGVDFIWVDSTKILFQRSDNADAIWLPRRGYIITSL